MSVTEEIAERGWGWPLGIGLVVAAVSAGPQLVKSGRPLVKRAIKGYLVVQERAREVFAETGERMQDIYAEAKHEHDQEMQAMGAEAEEQPKAEKASEGARPARRARKPQAKADEKGEE